MGQEFSGKEQRDDLFAATPPLAATRTLLSLAASKGGSEQKAHRLMIIDVKEAFLYGLTTRSVYIELPSEDPVSETGAYVGKLYKAMYGTRDAPQVWQGEVQKTMKKLGFSASVATPCLYVNEITGVKVVAHVDDFLCTRMDEQLNEVKKRRRARRRRR